MSIEALQSAAAGQSPVNTSAEAAKRALAGKEQFLQLLCAQISNQNPMNPMDDKDMVGQLAQFSAIEQAIETNTRLGALEKSQNSSARLGMAALIGKEGAASTRRINIDEPGAAPPQLSFHLEGAADNVTVRIIDSAGNLARTMDLPSMGPGPHQVAWDGRGKDKNPLPPGDYRMQVEATAGAGQEVAVRTEVRGIIDRIDMDGSEPAVFLGGTRVPVSELSELRH